MTKEIMNELGQTEKEFLNAYNTEKYNATKFSVTSDCLIFTVENADGKEESIDLDDKRLKIALIQRANHPHIDKWALPGGFVNKGRETSLEAAKRELGEETEISGIYLEQLYTLDDIERDQRDHIISVSYMSLVDKIEKELRAGSDAKKAEWFEVERKVTQINKSIIENGFIREKFIDIVLIKEDIKIISKIKEVTAVKNRARRTKLELVNRGGLAFDHAIVINLALDRIKNKVEYTDIMFNLLPEYFTIAEAYKVYQLTTNKNDTVQNFRKKFKNVRKMIIETDKTTKKYSPRPAKLYKLNIHWDDHEG
ncbi:NUDIX hydrolase [Wukongibacter sp. M2B1]|uniref:NUDIX hydrolase n=1 Tax=Wukongibacter sp. M2B1 TaxID=3088895 RepID=UPI003D7A34C3